MPETYRAVSIIRNGDSPGNAPFDLVVLAHDERRIRRRSIKLKHGDAVLVDFPEPTTLGDRDRLQLQDGRLVEIIAADELLHEVRGRDAAHLLQGRRIRLDPPGAEGPVRVFGPTGFLGVAQRENAGNLLVPQRLVATGNA